MKGQFMLISGIIAGLILISTASTISEIQSQDPDPDFAQYDVSLINEEAKELDLGEDDNRAKFREFVDSLSGYSYDLDYWESKECFNVTLRKRGDIYRISCAGEGIQSFTNPIFEILNKDDFDDSDEYEGTSAAISDNSGDLGIGYLNGETGDNLVGYWRMDRELDSASSEDFYNDFWTRGFSPGINVEEVDSSLNLGSSGSTKVTLNTSKTGPATWTVDVSLYNFSVNSISWTQNEILQEEGPIENIVPADLDHDGETELVWVDEQSEDVTFADRVSGTWTKENIGTQDGESVSVADIDDDGTLDVVGGGNDAQLYWWDNINGDGSSWDRSTIGSDGYRIRSVAAGDITGNGLIDVVTGGYSGEVKIYQNEGGSWSQTSVGSGGNFVVAIGDIDGDSSADILSGHDDGTLEWWDNTDGDGSSWTGNEISVEDTDIFSVAIEDVDEDGSVDVMAGEDDGEIRLYRNVDGDGTSWQRSKIGESASSYDVRALQTGDFDMDGELDIVAGFNAGDSNPHYFENDGTFSGWNREVLSDGGDEGHYGIAVIDIDGDGVLEMVSGEDEGEDASSSSIRVWKLNGIETSSIGSKTVDFSSSGSKTVEFTWVPDQVSENLVVEASPSRNFTETLETSDETAGSINNRVIQTVTPSGTVFDYSGEGNNGENFGAKRGVQGVFSTDSFSFDDSNDEYVDLNGHFLDAGDPVTVSAWVKSSDGISDVYGGIVGQLYGDTYNGRLHVNDNGSVQWQVKISGTNYYLWGPDVVDGTWHHVAATHDDTNGARLYVDGELKTSKPAATGDMDTDTYDTSIGSSAQGATSTYFFDGQIDEVRVYERQLTSDEIKDLYFSGVSGDFEGSYSSISYDLEDGQTVEDISVRSEVPTDTSAKIHVNHSSGSAYTFDLQSGSSDRNYSVNIPSGGSVELNPYLSSSDEAESPVIEQIRAWSNE